MCLMERFDRNAELTKLTHGSCYGIEHEDVELLKEIVVDVEWDGLIPEKERFEPYGDFTDSDEFDYS